FFFSSRRRHTRSDRDWSSDVCSSDLQQVHRDLVDLPAQPGDLAVQLVDDAIGALLLAVDIRQLVGQRVRGGAQAGQLLLDVGTRSEERRVGKECRFWWSSWREEKKRA